MACVSCRCEVYISHWMSVAIRFSNWPAISVGYLVNWPGNSNLLHQLWGLGMMVRSGTGTLAVEPRPYEMASVEHGTHAWLCMECMVYGGVWLCLVYGGHGVYGVWSDGNRVSDPSVCGLPNTQHDKLFCLARVCVVLLLLGPTSGASRDNALIKLLWAWDGLSWPLWSSCILQLSDMYM